MSVATYGAAQAGGADGAAGADSVLPAGEARSLPCIAAVLVNPEADDEDAVYENNRRSMRGAIEAAVQGSPADSSFGGGR